MMPWWFFPLLVLGMLCSTWKDALQLVAGLLTLFMLLLLVGIGGLGLVLLGLRLVG